MERRISHLIVDLRLCLRRLAYYMATTMENRLEWQRLMTRTRAMDAHLKEVFFSGMETPDGSRFGGKGFRSTWQEGVVAVATALKRAEKPNKAHAPGNGYEGDLVAPMIRDVGLALAMGDTVVDVMAAQMGKAGSNQNGGHEGAGGRDLHIGAWHVGVLPPTAPLPIASATMTGLAFAAWKQSLNRFHVACIGEGASSSGEYWEAITPQEREVYQYATFFKTIRLHSILHLLISPASNCGLTKPLPWDSLHGPLTAQTPLHGMQVLQQLENLASRAVVRR